MIVVWNDHSRLTLPRQLSHAQSVMQDITHSGFQDNNSLSYLVHQHSVVCYCEIVEYCHGILHGSAFRDTWVCFIKHLRKSTLNLAKSVFDGRHQRRRVTVHSSQAFFHFSGRFHFVEQESNHQPILLSLRFSKICGHACSLMRSKQNYESASAEVSTVAAYENVLHHSKFRLR